MFTVHTRSLHLFTMPAHEILVRMIILSCQIKSEFFLASQELRLQHHREDKSEDKLQKYIHHNNTITDDNIQGPSTNI